jgi:uncharacterized coiled-coil protein SlyX
MTEEEDEAEVSRRLVARDKFNELELNKCQIVESLIVVKRMCLTTDWKAKHSDLAGRFVKTSQELHAALCEGAFSIDRDPMELMPLFRRLQDEEASCGYARDAIRRWLAGLPVDIADDIYPSEDLTFDEADVIHHLNRIRLGLEYDGEGLATILDTDAALLHGIFHKLREKAAESEAEAQRLREEVRSLSKRLGLTSEKA